MALNFELLQVGLSVCSAALFVKCLLLPFLNYARCLFRQWLLTRDIPWINFLNFAVPLDRFLQNLENFCDKNRVSKTWLGLKCVILVREPDDIEVVLTDPNLAAKATFVYNTMKDAMGNGLLTINGPDHRRHRKAISPSLHMEILQQFVPIYYKNALKFAKRLELLAETGEVFDVLPIACSCANTTICDTMLTTNTECFQDKRNAFFESILDGSKLVLFRAMRPWLHTDVIFRLSSLWPQWNMLRNSINSFVSGVLDLKLSEETPKVTTATKNSANQRQTFLDRFLFSEDSHILNRSELIDELKTLVITGSGTSMELISFFLFTMSLIPDVQARVQKEIDDVLGQEDNRHVEAADLVHLEYLERVIKETLRYFPVVPVMGRNATGDVKLPSGFTIPTGSTVVVASFMLHKDASVFPDPHVFDPDRFLPEQNAGRHPFAYVPFSAGVRNCIGQRYAMMFAKTVFATTLRHFSFLPDPDGPRRLQDAQVVAGMTSSLRGGARVRVQKRHPALRSNITC